MGGWGRGWYGCMGVYHVHMHAHTHTCINMINMDASMLAAICNFCTCVCACVHACACMCTCVGAPSPPYTYPPNPQSCREPKTPKFNKSWTNVDNSILFEDSLPLNIPELIQTIVDHPRYPPPTCPTAQWGNPNQKNYNNSWRNRDNSILFWRFGTPELSCTHIDYIWCVFGGCSIPNGTFMFLTQKKYIFFAAVTLQ